MGAEETTYTEKDIDFTYNIRNEVFPEIIEKELFRINGGCKEEKNNFPIHVNKYFKKLNKQKKHNGKLELDDNNTINGIYCREAFFGNVGTECIGCLFYTTEKEKVPIFRYKSKT